MSLSKKAPVVNLKDRRNASQTGSSRNASSSASSSSSLPPLRAWDGSFAFDLIREITSPDFIDNIPKYDYYRANASKDTPSVSIYHVPNFLLHHVTNLSKISVAKSHSRDSMFSAAALYGSKRFYGSPEYLSFSAQHLRFSDACTEDQLEIYDQDDIHLLLSSLYLLETDCTRGYKRQVNYRVPEHVYLQILPPERDLLPVSQSALWTRFYMDALREMPDTIPSSHLSAMNAMVEDLYFRIGRLARKLEKTLDDLGIGPAEETVRQ